MPYVRSSTLRTPFVMYTIGCDMYVLGILDMQNKVIDVLSMTRKG